MSMLLPLDLHQMKTSDIVKALAAYEMVQNNLIHISPSYRRELDYNDLVLTQELDRRIPIVPIQNIPFPGSTSSEQVSG